MVDIPDQRAQQRVRTAVKRDLSIRTALVTVKPVVREEINDESLIELASPLPNQKADLCRICLDSTGRLISPCQCKGSVEHVHEHCMKKWIIKSLKVDLSRQKTHNWKISCEICSKDIRFSVAKTSYCRRPIGTEIQSKCALILGKVFIAVLFLIAVGILVYFGCKGLLVADHNDSTRTLISILLFVTATALLGLSAWLLTTSIITYFVREQVEIDRVITLAESQAFSDIGSPCSKKSLAKKSSKVYSMAEADSPQRNQPN